jgi:hypothetical protein
MCQGSQSRLPDLGIPKQMVRVNGEPNIRRTHRLIGELADVRSITTVGWPRLARAVDSLVTIPDPGQCILDGIDQTRFLWSSGRVVVLLGDVVFSRAALAGIFSDERDLFFAGTSDLSTAGGEVFGFAASGLRAREEAVGALVSCPCRSVRYGGSQGGHLRRLLWWIQQCRGLRPLSNHQSVVGPDADQLDFDHEMTWCEELYLGIDDWTDDIDTPADLDQLPELSRCARSEEQC